MITKTTRNLIAATAVAGLVGAGAAMAATGEHRGSGPHHGGAAMSQGAGRDGMMGKGHGRTQGRHQGRGQMGQGAAMHAPASGVAALPVGTLTAAEQQTLRHMREEEKLAHDVYVTLAATSQLPQFTRIAASETRHADAVKTLLDRHAITDPSAGRAAGSFSDPELQQLYDRLVEEGSTSAAAALSVGVQIETLDIADLEKAIAATGQADLKLVYGHLLDGSRHHLTAFSR